MNFSKNYNKTASHNTSSQKDKSSLSPLRLKNTNSKTKQGPHSKVKDKQNKSYTNLLSFQNIKSHSGQNYNQKSFNRQNINTTVNNSEVFNSARNKLFIYHQKPSEKEKSYSQHEDSSYISKYSHSTIERDKIGNISTYNKIKQMKKNYQYQLKERDKSKIISPQIKYFKNKEISFQQENIKNSYQNDKSVVQSRQIINYKKISPFKSSRQPLNMSSSKSTIQLLQSSSRNLSNEEISFQISHNYDMESQKKQKHKLNHRKEYVNEQNQHKNRQHQLIEALKLQNQSLKSTLGLYREQNQCLNSMNMNYKQQSKKTYEQIKVCQAQIQQKNSKIYTLQSQLKQYADIFSKLQDLQSMQEKMLKQNEKLKNKAKMNEGILQNISNMVRMSGYYQGQTSSKQGSIINSIRGLTQTFFNKQKEDKIK